MKLNLPSTSSHFRQFIGIDQTGAWNHQRNAPALLPMACIHLFRGEWVLETHPLKSLEAESFLLLGIDVETLPSLIAVDCVFWSNSKQTVKNLKTDFREAYRHRLEKGKVGREIAESFFKRHDRPPGSKRDIDQKTGAQSLYSPLPFQRNIQTGTFRIWSELGDPRNQKFNFFPWSHSSSKQKTWVVEGYPSLSWKNLFNSKTRSPGNLSQWIEQIIRPEIKISEKTKDLICLDQNYADAAVLALQAFMTPIDLSRLKNPSLKRKMLAHGYILGGDEVI